MKKILILGGADSQVKLIKAAKSQGYYVVLCDYTTTNPGIRLADKHYQVSTLDKDAVLKVAKKEKIDGVISNSEPAMENVSYIAEEMGLVGNSVNSIDVLLSKDKFRNLQKELKLYAPKHYVTNDKKDFWENIQKYQLPLIIKPVESSGSRGTTKIDVLDYDKCMNAFDECTNYSRNGFCTMEEFVESSINYIIDGDVFIYKDNLFWDGMFFNYRHNVFKMIPTTESWPLKLDDNIYQIVKSSLLKIFKKLDIKFGEFNVEMYLTQNNELFIIEINPRQGGCNIPISIKQHCRMDFSKLLVSLAVGDERYFKKCLNMKTDYKYFSKHMVFSTKSGVLKGIYIDDEIKKYVKSVKTKCKINSKIEKARNATSVIAYVDLVFDSYDNQKKYDCELEKYIYPIVEEKKEGD